MKLITHDPGTEMEMNMTPMIDVVFLLIIFFMVITDLTQADLEDLQLPVAQNADPDKPDPDEFRPVINIKQDGSIWVRREQLFDPEADDEYKRVREYLSDVAAKMEQDHFNKEEGKGPLIPDEALLVRADENTLFKHVQKIMELCGQKGIQIWKVQLAAKEPDSSRAPAP